MIRIDKEQNTNEDDPRASYEFRAGDEVLRVDWLDDNTRIVQVFDVSERAGSRLSMVTTVTGFAHPR